MNRIREYDLYIPYESNPGTPIKTCYRPKILKDGDFTLVEDGFVNTDDLIESYRPSTELATLISRYENGDLLALNSKPGFYGDVSKFPGNLAEAMQIVNNAEFEFARLPVDVKHQFSDDWRKWLAQFGTDVWLKSMGVEFNSDVKEVVDDAQKE